MEPEPVRLGEYLYYRNANPADFMTLYRFPVADLKKYGLEAGSVPLMPPKPSNDLFNRDIDKQQQTWEALEKEWPEESIFRLADLVQLYQDYAEQDERIKDFVEKMKTIIEIGSHDPLHYF